MADQAVERRLRVAAARFAAERRSAGPLDRYAPRCGNFVLVVLRIAVPGARSAPKRYWQPAKGSAGMGRGPRRACALGWLSRGGAPWLVRAARRAEALRAAADRLRALVRACRASCVFDAAACPSRFSARSVARDRAAETGCFRPLRPWRRACSAERRVREEVVPFLGAGRSMPALRALESPIAIACFVDRAPCLPSRTCSISSRTNSPACVGGARPARFA
jgi:hypothetical protein